jgi:DNA processing protein
LTTHNDLIWIALSIQPHVGIKTLRAIGAHFNDDWAAVLRADEKELRHVPGVGAKIAGAILALDMTAIKRQITGWQKQGVRILPRHHADYPPLLTTLNDEPATLFWRGIEDETLWFKSAAVVGRRSPTDATRKIAYQLGRRLAELGYTVVSGLAAGIDVAAHEGALSIAYGRTVAVLGSGVLEIYPPQHDAVAERIQQQGALVSEAAPDATVNAARLVARNRIIAGLAQHVIVVETEADGGAMYAARAATAQGRKLYALDIPVSGNQQLIKNGAVPVPLTAPDIASYLNVE